MKFFATFSALLLLSYICYGQKKKQRVFPIHNIKSQSNQKQASGFVYHDINKNRVMDHSEKGIPGVFVSNGIDIVQTNSKGEYEISVSDDAIIFVIKPKDWMTPLDKNNLPMFYYLHKPKGSPKNFTYTGVEPTGELPQEINFPLNSDQHTTKFKIIVFGDPQPYNIEQVDFLADDIIVELIDSNDVKFGMTMGDLVGDDLDLFLPVNQVVSKIGIPWYNVLGNHDVNYMASNDQLSDETFESVYGPSTYAFVYGNAHFIVIDDVIHLSSGSKKYIGGLRDDQLSFVSNYLNTVSKEDLVVITMHIPLAQHGKSFRRSDQSKLFDLLKDFPNTLSISAHTHVHDNLFFHRDSTDWKRAQPHHHFNVGTTSGSWWSGIRNETDIPHTMMRDGTPNGYSFISFDGSTYFIDWKVAGSASDHRMNIHLPRGIIANSKETTLLTVNFFNGSEESKLEYKIQGLTEWRTMEKVDKYDPYYLMLDRRWEKLEKVKVTDLWEADTTITHQPFFGTKMPAPKKSTHLWEANIGTEWPEGRHIIEVKATDRYGRVYSSFKTMRVVLE